MVSLKSFLLKCCKSFSIAKNEGLLYFIFRKLIVLKCSKGFKPTTFETDKVLAHLLNYRTTKIFQGLNLDWYRIFIFVGK